MLLVSSEQRGLDKPVNGSLTRLAGALRSAGGSLGEVLMPRTCPCCAVPVAYDSGSPLCEACLPQLQSALARVERVQVLQPLSSGDCVAGGRVPEVRAASRYEGIMPRALLALKNAGRTDLLPLLGEGLARSVYELLRDHREELQAGTIQTGTGFSDSVEVLLVPAPSSAQSVRGCALWMLSVMRLVIGGAAAPPYLLVWCLLVCLRFWALLRQRTSRRAWVLWVAPSGCTVPCASWNLPCARVG